MIQIITQNTSSRFLYVLDTIFSVIGKQSYRLSSIEELNYESPIVVYANDKPEFNCIHVCPHAILNSSLEKGEIKESPFDWNGIPCFLKADGSIPFDVFAASFWLLTRWEEYLPHSRDKHDRFRSVDSYAYLYGFLDRPIIDEWVLQLFRLIEEKWPNSIHDKRVFNHAISVDVDSPFAYKYKPLLNQFGGFIRDVFSLKFRLVKNRVDAVLGMKKDPFDTYQDFLLRSNNDNSVFFFHVGNKTKYDPPTPNNIVMRGLIESLPRESEIGIHPSYFSSERGTVEQEKEKLEQILEQKVYSNRFHFLKFNIPNGYNHLVELGITKDYSMGYPDAVGFRAGTCSPFTFFNLEKNEEQELELYPFAFMDACFIQYLSSTDAQSLTTMKQVVDKVKSVNGSLVTVWHNHSFSMEAGSPKWHKLMIDIMDYIHAK